MNAKEPENRFSKKIEIISRSEDLFGREVISLMISLILGGEKNERFDWSLSIKKVRRERLVVINELYQINFSLEKVLKLSTKKSYSAEVGEEVEETYKVWSLQFCKRLWS